MANNTTSGPSSPTPSGGGKPSGAAPANKGGTISKAGSVSMMMMAVLSITAILSLRGLSSQAEFGFTSIFYYLFAALVFLIPFSLVCAELASTWTKSGGLFRWCAEGLGMRWGWVAMYLEWQTVVIWFPSVLMFAAVALAYVFWPESFDARLSGNRIYTLILVLAVYWLSTFNCFRGMKSANKLSSLGGIVGTIIPGAILIILGIIYVATGHPIDTPMHQSFWPDFTKFSTIVLAASIFLFYGGMEMNAVHVPLMKDPAKTFPQSVLVAVIVILVVFIFGTLAISFVTPVKDINLLASLLTAYNNLWASIGVPWLGNIMAAMITFGVIGQVSVIIAGPSTGIFNVGQSGYLPPYLQKANKNGIQERILWIQGIFVTVLSIVLVVLPSVESAYQILSQMATVFYLIMVVIIYVAFVVLRYTEPNKKRGFKIPGGMFVVWLIAVIGILGALLALVLSFVPPSQITTGSPVVYVGILLVGSAFFCAIPFWVFARRKMYWRNPNAEFPPFDWQIEGRKVSEKSKWAEGFEPTPEMVQAVIDRENTDAAKARQAREVYEKAEKADSD